MTQTYLLLADEGGGQTELERIELKRPPRVLMSERTGIEVWFKPTSNGDLFDAACLAGRISARILHAEKRLINGWRVEYIAPSHQATGPSAGLAYFLHQMMQAYPDSTASIRVVAATGQLSEEQEEILAIGHVVAKVDAARTVLADQPGALILIPAANRQEIEAHDPSWLDETATPRLIAVATLTEALDAIGIPLERTYLNEAGPYRGLEAFDVAHRSLFFGREAQTDQVLSQLQATEHPNPTLILGPSGSGKSSFLRAGILARLLYPPLGQHLGKYRDDQVRHYPRSVFIHQASGQVECLGIWRPSDAGPLDETSLSRSLQHHWQRLLPEASLDSDSLDSLFLSLVPHLDRKHCSHDWYFAIDQMEELLRDHSQRPEIEHGLSQLGRFLQGLRDAGVWLLATLRDDDLGRLRRQHELKTLFDDADHWCELDSLKDLDLHSIISEPAQRAGIQLEDGLITQLLQDAQGNDALPLLEFTLSELYKQARTRKQTTGSPQPPSLRLADYEQLNGLIGAITQRAEQRLSGLESESRERTLGALARLARLEADDRNPGETRYLRQRVLWHDFRADERELLKPWIEERLLIKSGQGDQQSSLEVAHEALLRHFKPLSDWLAQHQEDLGWRQRYLIPRYQDWQANGQKDDDCLSGKELQQAERLLPHDTLLSSGEADYIRRSQHEHQQREAARREEDARKKQAQLEKETRQRRRFQFVALVAILLMVAASVAGWKAWQSSKEAKVQQKEAQHQRELAEKALTDETKALADKTLALEAEERAKQEANQQRDKAQQAEADAKQSANEASESAEQAKAQTKRALAMAWLSQAKPKDKTEVSSTDLLKTILSYRLRPFDSEIVSGLYERAQWLAAGPRAMYTSLEQNTNDEQFAVSGVESVAFSPDGKRIVSVSHNNTLRLWDAATRQPIGVPLRGHTSTVNSVAFSPDGKRIVSGSYDKTLRLWDAYTGQQLGKPLRGHEGFVFSVAFSPDGKRIVSGSGDNTLRLWDSATGQPIGEPMRGHSQLVLSVAFSPDGKWIASGGHDKTLRLWNAITGQPIGEPLRGHRGYVNSVAFSPDGKRIVSSSDDNTLRLWDVAKGQPIGEPLRVHEVHEVHGRLGRVNCVAFSPDGSRIVSVGVDGTLRQWDAATGQPIGEPLHGHHSDVRSVAFSPDSKHIVSGDLRRGLLLWDVTATIPNGDPLRGRENFLSSVVFSLDSQRVVSGSVDGKLHQWNAASGQPIGTPMPGHKGFMHLLVFSPDGKRIVSGGADNALHLWDASTGRPIGEPLRGHEKEVSSVAFSPDGKRIVSGSWDETLRLWDAASGKPIGKPLLGHEDRVWSVDFSPDGKRIVSGSDDQTLRLWDASTGKPMGEPLRAHQYPVLSAVFSPDGKRIVSHGGGEWAFYLWDAARGRLIGKPLRHDNRVTGFAVSEDGRRIVSGSSDYTLRLWDAASGKQIGNPLRGHRTEVNSVAFSPDGKRIASGGGDGALRLWDAASGKPTGEPLSGDPNNRVAIIVFSPDGKRLVSESEEGTLRLWLTPEGIIDHLCKMVGRNPSRQELAEWGAEGVDLPTACPGYPTPQ